MLCHSMLRHSMLHYPMLRRVMPALLSVLVMPGDLIAQRVVDDDPNPHSNIELLSDLARVRPGQRFTVGLRVTLDPGWHTYWTNGGDAGLPLNVAWTLPTGVTAGPLAFPAPRLMPQPPLMSYGYEREVVYLAELQLPPTLVPGQRLRIEASADWLACADVCLPAAGTVRLDLPISTSAIERDTSGAASIARARQRMPRSGAGWSARTWRSDSNYVLAIVPPASGGAALVAPYFFADTNNLLEHATPQRVVRLGDTIVLGLTRSQFANANTTRFGGVLVADASREESPAWNLVATLTTASAEGQFAKRAEQLLRGVTVQRTGGISAPPVAGAVASYPAGGPSGEPSHLGLAAAVFFAFVGGLLLNLMPCVFPVLSVKVLGFLEHSNGDSRRGLRHGLVFGVGVLATFLLLAGSLMALRAGGAGLGWGFQLQSPTVVALLALVMFALALNLSGVFEIGMALTRLGGVGAGRSYTDSALTGALAVVVATPCTAPFMGAALGYALVQPPAAGLLVFTSLAVGLALPYVVLSASPGLLRYLPRPGAWLETLKQLLAFPLYATVVWLLWVFGQQANIDALAVLLLGLTLFALGAWSWNRAALGRGRWLRVLAVVAMTGALAVAASAAGASASDAATAGATASDATKSSAPTSVTWEKYSPARVNELRTQGHPVLVDFTAAWCLSCQVNERVALRSDAVRRVFLERNVALLRADWTSRDAGIAAVLASFGRSGVPLYVLYPAAESRAPELLPSVLTPGMVVRAVERATQ